MDENKIIKYYNGLDEFAQNKIDKELIDLMNVKNESRNYCIKYCPKCGAYNESFQKNGISNSGK